MKKLTTILFAFIVIAFNDSCTSEKAKADSIGENITFYDVPLVCGAYVDIGCGSRAKPALMELEKNPAIKEAWLNREGTAFAIVWNGPQQTDKIAKPVFEKYEIDFQTFDDKQSEKLQSNFRKNNLWYKGSEVDKLSLEEAEHIASTLTDFGLKNNLISSEEGVKIKSAVENYFKTELVKIRTPEQLYDDSENKFKNDLVAISESIVGKERTMQIATQYFEYSAEQCKINSACTKEGTKDCCKKRPS